MPETQSIVVITAVCGLALLAFGLYRLWSIRVASNRGRIRAGRRRLPGPGARGRRRQIVFAAVYLLIGAFLLFGARPRMVLVGAPQGFLPAAGLAAEVARIVDAEDGRIGFLVGIVRDGKRQILGHGTLGLADGRPPRGDTVFPIGSVTKTFTGILLADMVARGEVGLADPVRRYLPPGTAPPSWEGNEITLLDLATHTSGLPRMPPYMGATPGKLLT